jgi:hypothetical protein
MWIKTSLIALGMATPRLLKVYTSARAAWALTWAARVGESATTPSLILFWTDLLLRQAEASRAGAQGDHDYEVIGPDEWSSDASLRPPDRLWGHPGCGRSLTEIARPERRPTATRQHGRALCRHSLGVGQRDVFGNQENPDTQLPRTRDSRFCLSFLVKIKAVPARTCIAREFGLGIEARPCFRRET